jgi:hypothetical protein
MASGLALAAYVLLLVPGAVLVWRRPAVALYAWIVGLAAHNAVMATLYGAGVRGGALTAIQAWKEILLAVALTRVALEARRAGRLAFGVHPADVLAVAFAAVVCVYAVLPQSWLAGSADHGAIGLALKHDLVPVGAYFLGRSVILQGEDLIRLVWTVVGTAAAVAVLGLLDDFFVPISWWRDSAVVDYFHKHLGYDYHGTGGLPENFVFNNGGDAEGFYRRLVSTFLGPLASAYTFVVALLLAAAFLRRARILIPLTAAIFAGLLFTFSRSSLLALAAGLVVLAVVRRRWWPVAAAIATLAVSIAWVHAFPDVAPQGRWTQQDLIEQRNNAKNQPGASGSAGSIDEPSIHSHWISLREGVRTVVHHPQGFGLGNAGQTASRTGTTIKAGESNYTEIGAETGLAGALLFIAWSLALFGTLIVRAWRGDCGPGAAAVAAALAAVLALAIQTDVVGVPWIAYCLWWLAGSMVSQRREQPGG